MPIIGQTLLKDAEVFTPWFSRPDAATAAVFLAYVIDAGSGGTVTIEVFDRNTEDTDTGGPASGSITTNQTKSTTIQSVVLTGIKEMVRFKLTVGGDAGGWVHVAFPHPIFYTEKQ